MGATGDLPRSVVHGLDEPDPGRGGEVLDRGGRDRVTTAPGV